MDSSLEKLFNQLCDDFNYSMQEFLYFAINNTDFVTVVQHVRNILRAFVNKHRDVGLKNEILLVVIFLLCFSSEPVAFFILSSFYESIYPRTLYFKEVEEKGTFK
jgi:hypothetical protein